MCLQQAWVCHVCKKRLELLAKTGQWYHGGQAQPVGLDLNVDSGDSSSVKADVSPSDSGRQTGKSSSYASRQRGAGGQGLGRTTSRGSSQDSGLSRGRSVDSDAPSMQQQREEEEGGGSRRRDAGSRGDGRRPPVRDNSLDGGSAAQLPDTRGEGGRIIRTSNGGGGGSRGEEGRIHRTRSMDQDRATADEDRGNNRRSASPLSRDRGAGGERDRSAAGRGSRQSPRSDRDSGRADGRQSPRHSDSGLGRQSPRQSSVGSERMRRPGLDSGGERGSRSYSRDRDHDSPVQQGGGPGTRRQRPPGVNDRDRDGGRMDGRGQQWERQPERLMGGGMEGGRMGPRPRGNYGGSGDSEPTRSGGVSPSRRPGGYRDERLLSASRYPEPQLRRHHLDPSMAATRTSATATNRQPLGQTPRTDSLSSDPSDTTRGASVPRRSRRSRHRQGSLSSSDDELQTTSECTSCEDQEAESESFSERGTG
jgi:hypothetical protein